jgi:integrase
MIEQFKKERRGSFNRQGELRSPSSVNRELELLSRIFSLAVERGEMESNPFKGVKKLAADNLITRYLTADEEERLLAVLTGRRAHLRPIVLLGLHTGMRRGEILSLQWEQVDFARELIQLLRTKSGKPRSVPMNSVVKATLLEQRERVGNSEYVFPNRRTGKALTDIKNAFSAALKKAGIEDFRFHDIRHSAGTRMADAGVPITAVSDILGHADIRTTMRYAHATDEARRRAVNALEEASRRNVSKIWPKEKRVAN